jgi:hypothetical protein
MTSHPSYGASVSVTLLNNVDDTLWGQVFTPYGSGSGTVPASDAWYSYWFTHYPATRGTAGIPRKVRIQSNINDVYSYQITVTRRPRPGYNLGGTAFSNAPLMPLGTEIKGNVITSDKEPGQFWKIHLEPGQKIWLTGEATGPNTDMTVSLFDANEQLINQWFASFVPSVHTPFPTPYPEFVNGPQAADYYLRATTRWWPVWDFRFVVQNTPGPRLKLFLEADDPLSFNIADPQNDDDSGRYVPGSVSDGTSDTVAHVCGEGQPLQLVAAFVNAAGQIVPPPTGVTQVEFELEQTTAFTGCTMNFGTSTDADFSLVGNPVVNFNGNVATIGLRARDYGGFTIARAVTSGLHTDAIQIPKDDGLSGGKPGNWLPDAGWTVLLGLETPQDDKQDQWEDLDDVPPAPAQPPPSGGLTGDGLTRFEEYRGFVARGIHYRTNPEKKDVFVASYISWMGDSNIGIGYGINLQDWMGIHQVWGETDQGQILEYADVTVESGQRYRVINLNAVNNAPAGPAVSVHVDQRAILVRDEAITATDCPTCIGNTFSPFFTTVSPPCPPSGGVIPNDLPYIQIDLNRHQQEGLKPQNLNSQAEINNEIRRTIGHELGHAMHVLHRPVTPAMGCYDGADVGPADTIMSSGWADGHDQFDFRSLYNVYDVRQIRLVP